jgi:hypothetical protein
LLGLEFQHLVHERISVRRLEGYTQTAFLTQDSLQARSRSIADDAKMEIRRTQVIENTILQAEVPFGSDPNAM